MKSWYYDEKTRAIADLTPLTPQDEHCPGGGDFELNRINVPEAHRGKGHGTRLLQRVIAAADQEEARLFLYIMSSGPLDNEMLFRWYKRHGFRPHYTGMMERSPR